MRGAIVTASSLSDAQITILVHALRSPRCPVCRRHKNPKLPLCKACYFSLPEEMAAGMAASLAPDFWPDDWFLEKYAAVKTYLARQAKGEVRCG